ncbi:MAG: pyridoxal phosphate-dependent aminotransferase [Bacteroidales bacterium]|nr:pyridoxal phosphate-dependent aminotransferase [Bacteroidales bacterium]
MEKYQKPECSLISFFSNKVKKYGGINFAQGVPGFSPPNMLLQITSEIVKRKDVHQYAPASGIFKLVDLIRSHYIQYFNNINEENIIVLHGATEAICLTYLFLKQKLKKLKILGFEPVYEIYDNLAKIYNDKFYFYDYFNSEIDFDKIESIIQKEKINLIFINSPGNPFGKIFSEKEMLQFYNISTKYKVYIIIDAVYRELYFNKPPFLQFDLQNEYLFYVNSFSKLLSITGWRVGYLISNVENIKKIKAIHDYVGLCVVHPLQAAIAEYIEKEGFISKYVIELRQKMKESFLLMKNKLEELRFKIPKIDGGYFIWAELPSKFKNGFKFAVDLYETKKVAIVPGEHFAKKAKNYVRFNAAREKEEILQGLELIKQFINNS